MNAAQGIQYYPFNIAAGKTIELAAPGSYIRYMDGVDSSGVDASVLVRGDTGAVLMRLKPGQGIKLPDGYTRWYISGYSGTAVIAGNFAIGDGEIVDSSVVGTVSVVDGGLARTLANQAMLSAFYQAPVAGNYSHGQLWNPVGSGRRLFLEAVVVSSATAGVVAFGSYGVQLAVNAGLSHSKLCGGNDGVGNVRSQALAAGTLGVTFGSLSVLALTSYRIDFREPVVVPEGQGFTFFHGSANSDLRALLESYES